MSTELGLCWICIFIDEKTEAQGRKVTCPRWQSWYQPVSHWLLLTIVATYRHQDAPR